MSSKRQAYLNKNLKRWEEDRQLEYHTQNIRNVRPITSTVQTYGNIQLNHRKRQMQIENKLTQIQKSNRILLQRITGIMNKKQTIYPNPQTQQNSRLNKSLNNGVRKRQLQSIQIQNARFLKRLQTKKPHYDTDKMKQDWKKQKKMIQNLSNFPLVLTEKKRTKRKSMIIPIQKKTVFKPIEICRMRVIDGQNFLITLRLNNQKLKIVGDSKNHKEVKVIQIQKQQAIDFIQNECDGSVQNIFERLMYDRKQQILYLVGKQVQLQRYQEEQDDGISEAEYHKRAQNLMSQQKEEQQQLRQQEYEEQTQSDLQQREDNPQKVQSGPLPQGIRN